MQWDPENSDYEELCIEGAEPVIQQAAEPEPTVEDTGPVTPREEIQPVR